ncbi:hypothetical protein [Streptomyces flavalbus]|uniref:Uncharacterized protein n=1 Tax=Streptomyces flavalbus TaxID=2665155 RepID=A0ABW2WF43_9ACTN
MRIEILSLLDTRAPGITFRSPLGQAWAQWSGTERPGAGDIANVEFDIPDEVGNWAPADGPDTLHSHAPEEPVRIRGVVTSTDEDDPVVAVRCGTDILLVEFPPAHKPPLGARIEFTTPRINAYPYSL